MSNEQIFYESCKIMANMEDVIKTFDNMGFIVEPYEDNIGSKIYNVCDRACSIATSLLKFPSICEANEIYNKLMEVTGETVENVSREVWKEYGIK